MTSWRAALLLPALAPIVLAYRTEPLTDAVEGAPAQHAAVGRGRRLPGAFWAVLVSVVSIEFCIAFWLADFLRSARAGRGPPAGPDCPAIS